MVSFILCALWLSSYPLRTQFQHLNTAYLPMASFLSGESWTSLDGKLVLPYLKEPSNSSDWKQHEIDEEEIAVRKVKTTIILEKEKQ